MDTEIRQAYETGYTNAHLEAAGARAERLEAEAESIAYIETAVRILESAFELAEVSPEVVDGCFLSSAVRCMALTGEAAYKIEAGNGGAAFTPVVIEQVRTRTYKLEGIKRPVPIDDILHLTWSTMPGARRGRSPLRAASGYLSAVYGGAVSSLWIACLVERALLDESRLPVGALYSIPEDYSEDEVIATGQQIEELHGRPALLSTPNVEAGAGNPNRKDWDPSRIQPDPTEGLLKLRDQLRSEIIGNLGVPVSMVLGSEEGPDREGARRLLQGTLRPLASRIGAEFRRKVKPIKILFPNMGPDIQSKARAFKALVEGGIKPDKAASMTGLEG